MNLFVIDMLCLPSEVDSARQPRPFELSVHFMTIVFKFFATSSQGRNNLVTLFLDV